MVIANLLNALVACLTLTSWVTGKPHNFYWKFSISINYPFSKMIISNISFELSSPVSLRSCPCDVDLGLILKMLPSWTVLTPLMYLKISIMSTLFILSSILYIFSSWSLFCYVLFLRLFTIFVICLCTCSILLIYFCKWGL